MIQKSFYIEPRINNAYSSVKLIDTTIYDNSILLKMFQQALTMTTSDRSLHENRRQYNSLKLIIKTYPLISQKILQNAVNVQVDLKQKSTGRKLYDFMYALTTDRHYITIQQNIQEFLNTTLFPDFVLYHIHMFNCMLRRFEGYFINQSLIQMKSTITKFLLHSLKKNYTQGVSSNDLIRQILYYQGHNGDQCYSNYLYQPFSFFTPPPQVQVQDELISNKNDIIFNLLFSKNKISNTVQGIGMDPDKTRLVVFTVINCNDAIIHDSMDNLPSDLSTIQSNYEKIYNNPPNPPYINTNILKKYITEKQYIDNIEHFISQFNDIGVIQDFSDTFVEIKKHHVSKYAAIEHKFKARIKQYNYYNNDTVFNKLIEDNLYQHIDEVIQYIENNNETTLIGTLNFMNFTSIFDSHSMIPICCDPPFLQDFVEHGDVHQHINLNPSAQMPMVI